MIALPSFFYRDPVEGVDELRAMRSRAEARKAQPEVVCCTAAEPCRRIPSEADRRHKRMRIVLLVQRVIKEGRDGKR